MRFDEGIFGIYARMYENRREVEYSLEDYLRACSDDPSFYAGAAERLLKAIGEPVKVLEANAGARIAYIDRLGAAIVPQATTVLQEGDVVHVMALESDVNQIASTFAKRERGAH